MSELVRNYITSREKMDELKKNKKNNDIKNTHEYIKEKEKFKYLPHILLPFFIFFIFVIYRLGFVDFIEILTSKNTILSDETIESLDHVPYLFCLFSFIFHFVFYIGYRDDALTTKLNKFKIKNNSVALEESMHVLSIIYFILFFTLFLTEAINLNFLVYDTESLSYLTIFSIQFKTIMFFMLTTSIFYFLKIYMTKKAVKNIKINEQIELYKKYTDEEDDLKIEVKKMESEIVNSSENMKEVLNRYATLKDEDIEKNHDSYFLTLINILKEKNKEKDLKAKEIKELEMIYADVYNKQISVNQTKKISINNE